MMNELQSGDPQDNRHDPHSTGGATEADTDTTSTATATDAKTTTTESANDTAATATNPAASHIHFPLRQVVTAIVGIGALASLCGTPVRSTTRTPARHSGCSGWLLRSPLACGLR